MTGGYAGRKLFVGGLPPKVDEKALRDVFSRFWHIEEGLLKAPALRLNQLFILYISSLRNSTKGLFC